MKRPRDLTDTEIKALSASEMRAILHECNPFAGYLGRYGKDQSVMSLRATIKRYRDFGKKTTP